MSFEIKCIGTVKLEQYEIKDIEGGFGEGKKCLLVKDIAMLHKREVREINEVINRNFNDFVYGEDILDLLGIGMSDTSLIELGFTIQAIRSYRGLKAQGKQTGIYILSERGYALLLKFLNDPQAKARYKYLLTNYFDMRKELKEIKSDKDTYLLNIVKADNEVNRAIALNEYEIKYVKPLENQVKELNINLESIKNTLRDTNLKNEDLQNIIDISSSQLRIKDKRQLTVDIVRKDCSPRMMAQRFRLLIDNYNSTLRTNVYIRFENYNAKNKPKMISYVEFIDKVDNKIDILLGIAIKLYKSNFVKIIDDYKTIILGGNA